VEEIGLFPLELVLVPTERVPLHIFEPRYRDLINECLDTGAEFGLVLGEDDAPRDVGTRTRVVDVLQRFDDGRLNVAVEGGERFRIARMTSGRSYLTAEVESLFDDEVVAPTESRERGLALYRRLAEIAETDADEPAVDSGILSFELAARVDFGIEAKQELLESRSEGERLARVVTLLEAAVQTMATQREVSERAATNGRVSRP
jgi:Lon protease-like protein